MIIQLECKVHVNVIENLHASDFNQQIRSGSLNKIIVQVDSMKQFFQRQQRYCVDTGVWDSLQNRDVQKRYTFYFITSP